MPPDTDAILAQAVRHDVERQILYGRLVEHLRRSLGAIPAQLLVDLANDLTAAYIAGRTHGNERLALRLELPIGEEAILVRWPDITACPKEQPHAHVRFAAPDDRDFRFDRDRVN